MAELIHTQADNIRKFQKEPGLHRKNMQKNGGYVSVGFQMGEQHGCSGSGQAG